MTTAEQQQDDQTGAMTCPECEGRGAMPYFAHAEFGAYQDVDKCDRCEGSGNITGATMTDDQTPGVAAMGDAELLLRFANESIALSSCKGPHDVTQAKGAAFTASRAEILRRLAAGPTLAETITMVNDTMFRVLGSEGWDVHGQALSDLYNANIQALTPLWPDGEHHADTVTISRDDVSVFIDAIKAVQERHPEVRDYYQPYVDRLVLATVRPHQADPQEAM